MNNILILAGRITKELEKRYTNSNKAVVEIPLAVNNGQDDTTFITITVFGNIAETTSQYCHKGDMLGVQAVVKNHNWEDKDGKKHYDYRFIANKITFLQTKKTDESKEKINTQSDIQSDTQNDTQADPFADFGQQVSIDENWLD